MDYYSREATRSGVKQESPAAANFKKSGTYRWLGIILCLLAVFSLGVGVADVALSALVVCKNETAVSCPPKTAPTNSDQRSMAVLFSYIASGIWGSLFVFVVGMMSVKASSNKQKSAVLFTTFAFLTAFIIIPAMLVFNIVEAYWIMGGTPKIYDQNDTATVLKFVTPVAVAVLALLEFLVLAGILLKLCTSISTQTTPKPAAGFQETAQTSDEKYGYSGRGQSTGLDPYASAAASPYGNYYGGGEGGGGGGGGAPGGGFPMRPMFVPQRYDGSSPYGYGPYSRPAGGGLPGPIRRNPVSYVSSPNLPLSPPNESSPYGRYFPVSGRPVLAPGLNPYASNGY